MNQAVLIVFVGILTNELAFKEPECTLPSLYKPAIGPYVQQDLSSQQHQNTI